MSNAFNVETKSQLELQHALEQIRRATSWRVVPKGPERDAFLKAAEGTGWDGNWWCYKILSDEALLLVRFNDEVKS